MIFEKVEEEWLKNLEAFLIQLALELKKLPHLTPDSFYKEEETIEDCKKILEDFVEVHKLMQGDLFHSICIPKGIGTGLSRLEENAPSTFEFLKNHKIMCIEDYKDKLLITD